SIYVGNNPTMKANLTTQSWEEIYHFLKTRPRKGRVQRKTRETEISVTVNLDGSGKTEIHTGLSFYDHMLEQIARHGNMDLDIHAKGDLEIDEHHTIEDTAISLGQAFSKALGSKKAFERYGFVLPM